MATVSDLTNIPFSSLPHIDALLDTGPDWNYLTTTNNTIYYTFSVTSGNEDAKTTMEIFSGSQQAFNQLQQAAVRELLKAGGYLAGLTGINFVETAIGADAHLHFCNVDLKGVQVTGMCSWQTSYQYEAPSNKLKSYDADAYVYLDNVESGVSNASLIPGTVGYETLLHELGHALGLKHSFYDPTSDNLDPVYLPAAQDNTSNTLMAYKAAGGPYSAFNPYDVAALNWLYGRDGLGGKYGINSETGGRYLTGTNQADSLLGTEADDMLEGAGGNDHINGGGGYDTVVLRGTRSEYQISQAADGTLIVASAADGVDALVSIEVLQFSDGGYTRAQLGSDTTAPAAPTLNVYRNANGYAQGSMPLVTGAAEANSTVKVYAGETLLGTTRVDATGLWTLTTAPLKDGLNYAIHATATDAAGNTSVASATIGFHVDALPPVMPTGAVSLSKESNHPIFSGTAEPNTIIQIIRVTDATEIGRATASAEGFWRYESAAIPNGDYTVAVVSVDKADNATSAAQRLDFTVASPLNASGDAAANVFSPGAGDNAIDGQGGMDVARYAGTRSSYTVKKEVFGHSVADGSGERDTLVNVERVQFADKWLALDINGAAGQVYRIYQAAFDRVPDPGGYAYWLSAMDKGYSLNQVANLIMGNKEFIDMYMSDPSDANFVNQLYAHVLHRAPDAAGQQWWINNINAASRAEVLAMFTESPENQAQVIGAIQHGIEYTPWV